MILYFFLGLSFFTTLLINGMHSDNIPKLALGGVVAVSRPATPRTPIGSYDDPNRQAYELANFINYEDYDQALTMIFNPKKLKSYGPAIILREIVDGNITV